MLPSEPGKFWHNTHTPSNFYIDFSEMAVPYWNFPWWMCFPYSIWWRNSTDCLLGFFNNLTFCEFNHPLGIVFRFLVHCLEILRILRICLGHNGILKIFGWYLGCWLSMPGSHTQLFIRITLGTVRKPATCIPPPDVLMSLIWECSLDNEIRQSDPSNSSRMESHSSLPSYLKVVLLFKAPIVKLGTI
jgi:hypothetical protein